MLPARLAHEKAPQDLVTEADLASQKLIEELLLGAFPDHDFLGEEKPAQERRSPYRWLVDPLDGTVNYAHSLDPWCVSIALERDDRLIAGVVHAPALGRTFSAALGCGARENGNAISVSKAARMRDSLTAAGMPTAFGSEAERQMAIMGRFSTGTHGVRRTGSSAWNLAMLASGSFDLCYATSVHSWDVAAGVLLVLEAGGVVTNLSGNPFVIDRPELLASNGKLHAEAVAAVEEAWPRIGEPGGGVLK